MTTIGWVVCPICLLGVGFSGVWNSILLMDARKELNRLLPKEEQGEILFASLDWTITNFVANTVASARIAIF